MPEPLPGNTIFKELVNCFSGFFQLADISFNITYTSDGVEEMLGFLPEEMTGKNLVDYVHIEDREKVKDWMVNTKKQFDILSALEYRIKNKQGEYIWIENNARNMLRQEEVKAVVMEFRNIQSKKIADKALLQVEQRLSLLLNNTEESFIVLNSRLRIITYNKAAQEQSPQFLKLPLQSGISVLDLIDKEEKEEYVNVFEQVFQGNNIEKETYYREESGANHIYNHKFNPLIDKENDISGVFITSKEITEQKKLTEKIVVQSERLKNAQKIARLGYFEYNFFSKTIFCSDELYEILELAKPVESINDLSITEENLGEGDREMVRREIEKSLYQKKDFNIEFCLKLKAGGQKVILAMGGAVRNAEDKNLKFNVTLQDITESKMAVLAIQTLENKFTSVFNNSVDGILLTSEEEKIISANPSVCRLLGYSAEELSKIKNYEIVEMESDAFEEMVTKRRETGSFSGEILFKHKSGSIIPVEVTSGKIKDGNGETYYSTIIRDITEKKKIEAEQNALTGELIKNNHDLQQFSYITSHNLRAPVANLLSLLSLYNRENTADEFNKVMIEKFEEATRQLGQTLNDLFDVLVIKSNSSNIDNETISFSKIYVEVRKNINRLLMQQNGTIETDFLAIDEIKCNRIHVESIFFNMISNAIKYSSPARQLKLNIRSYNLNNWALVEFEDNGLGIDLKRYGGRLFGLYQRFHNNKEGKGLGLYMTRTQVLAMGGKIEVESEPEKGTIFRIFFKM